MLLRNPKTYRTNNRSPCLSLTNIFETYHINFQNMLCVPLQNVLKSTLCSITCS